MDRKAMFGLMILGIVISLCFIGVVFTGLFVGWGPFKFLQFDSQEQAIQRRYPAKERQGEIVFYGASNFRLWTEMEQDLSGLKVQNHGFGGSTDRDLLHRAGRLLYPYAPRIVVFQTGSNDYVKLPGTVEEQTAACVKAKQEMFAAFHDQLPEAKFIVMSGLLLPGRSQYTELTERINLKLKKTCESTDYLYFVDASALTYDGANYANKLFIADGIHLNHDGQLRWCEEYIHPALEAVINEFHMDALRKEN